MEDRAGHDWRYAIDARKILVLGEATPEAHERLLQTHPRCAAAFDVIERDGLVYVSPRTGRAVSAAGAGVWADRLLPLPPVLLGQGEAPDAEISEGLRTTGHFLHTWLAPALGDRPLPEARQRLVDRLARRVTAP